MPIKIQRTTPQVPAGLSDAQKLLWEERLNTAHKQEAAEAERKAERERVLAERERRRAMPPEYVLTLVHGTRLPFTRKAEWVCPSSQLATELTERLGCRVRIEPFDWGGGNSAKARADGARKLRDHLDHFQAEPKYKGAQHVVIAHSHGGNVAVTAMESAIDEKRILGVVTLGTPFLSATRRTIDEPLNPAAGLVAALAAGFSVVVLGAAYGHGWTWWTWGALVATAVASALILGAWIAKRMERHAERTFKGMPRTALSPDQLLIIRTEGDEAAAVLSGARVAGACIDLVWRGLSQPIFRWMRRLLEKWDYLGANATERLLFSRIEKRTWEPSETDTEAETEPVTVTGAIMKHVLPLAGPLISVLLEQRSDDPRVYWVLASVALLYGLPALLALVVTVVSVPFMAVFAIGLLPSGWSLPLAGPFLDVTAEPAPPGKWWVTQIEPSGGKGLAHSKSYEDHRVFDAIAVWVKDRAKQTDVAAMST